ncbi:MAG: hypothetical protein U1E65_17135 [Myxococcota bacterium]
MLRETRAIAALAAVAILGVSGRAQAAGNDFRLNARSADGNGILFTGSTPNPDAWRRLTTELAYVMSPRLAEPAETLGHAGFQVAMLWSGSLVSSGESYWGVTERAQLPNGKASPLLSTLQLDLKKGLPFSFELGANVAWLVESNMVAPGLEVRWTFQEGYALAPDVGIRAGVTHLVGNRDLSMTVVGIDGVISKGFGIGGFMHLAPYLSWTVMMVAASSRVIDPTPTVDKDFGDNFVFPELKPGDNIHHKLTLGARALFYVLNLSFQSEFEMLEKDATGTKFFGSVATVSVKLGAEF